MKRVTAFVGSARKKNTYRAVEHFLKQLQELGEVEYEIVRLSEYKLEICRGCQICFNKGEQFCPLKDDRDVLFDKINGSDGIALATPNYNWDMSGMMKVFLDRFGYAVHRPHYFGKAFTSIVTQAMGRGDKIVETFDFAASILGFNTLKGVTITGFDQQVEEQQHKIERTLTEHSKRFYTLLTKPAYPAPTLFQLLSFRIGRTTVHKQADPTSPDYQYYARNGWFESDYYYPTYLAPWKKATGNVLESMLPAVRKILL